MSSSNHPARWGGSGKRSVQASSASREETPAVEVAAELEPEPAFEYIPPEPEPEEPLATDAARDLAAEHGIDLSDISGSGAEGRITKDDVAAYLTVGD